MINSKTHNNPSVQLPFLISGGVDCLLSPYIMKNFINKSFDEIKYRVLEEVETARKMSMTGISISIPNLGDGESNHICEILNLSHTNTDLLWLVNISHSPLNVVEKAVDCVNNIPVVNFVTLEKPRVNDIFKIIKKVNGVIIVQLIDEQGLPHTIEDRLRLIKKLEQQMIDTGLNKENILVDILTPPLGTIFNGIEVVIETLKSLKEYGFKTITWLNNISVGHEHRKDINLLYATLLVANGIDIIVLDSHEEDLVRAIQSIKETIKKGK